MDPVHGSNSNDGSSRALAVSTVGAAWNLIPSDIQLSVGYRIQLVAGKYTQLPNYWENKYGTKAYPIILNSVDGLHQAKFMSDINMYNVHYFYILGVDIIPKVNCVHLELCSYFLLRNSELDGGARTAQDTFKANQCDHIYIEDSDIHGAFMNTIQYVGVQYGHIRGNNIHNSSDWCVYNKCGSAYIDVSNNDIYDCGTGGYLAGQGCGMEFMQYPWIHYQAYGISVTNNVIHNTDGAGLGVNGGYNIVMAHNTLFHVGSISHTLEFFHGGQGCNGYNISQCNYYHNHAGWGPVAGEDQSIPNKHIYVINNIVYNVPPFHSQWSHFSVHGPVIPAAGSNVPSPSRADEDIRIIGNIIYNGPNTSVDLGFESGACEDSNPTCNPTLVTSLNAINKFVPSLINTASGDYRPTTGGGVLRYTGTVAIPTLSWSDTPTPKIPDGARLILVNYTRAGFLRDQTHLIAGAY